ERVELSQKLASLNKEHSSAKKELVSLQGQLKESQAISESLKAVLLRKGTLINDIEKKLNHAESDKIKLRDEVKSLQDEGAELSQKLAELKRAHSVSQDKITSLNAGLSRSQGLYRQELQKVQQEAARLKESNVLMGERLNEYQVLTARSHKFPEKVTTKEDIYRAMGYLYSLVGDVDNAISFYKKTLKLNPEDKDVHYNLAYLWTQKGMYRQAADSYKKALKGNPLDKEIYYNLAVIFANYLKDEEKSNMYYEKFIEAD
ncbi:MAG: tetratricopeptide repeat protein, partial [Candidatus Omnitrophica bacterium]|nr:tetratricopeptide repeat protein [Candidatus Omnitrophota bacterium]